LLAGKGRLSEISQITFLQAIDLFGFMWGWPVLQGGTGPGEAAKEIVFLYI
jgi:hypothetical protein